jgi:hypothetical protein
MNPTENPSDPRSLAAQKSTEEIQEEVRRARAVIVEDIKEIGERLRPDQLKASAREAWDTAKGQAMERVTSTGKNVVQTGAPYLLIGLGAGWLAKNMRERRREVPYLTAGSAGYLERPEGYAAGELGYETTPSYRERAEEYKERAADVASELGSRARDVTSELGSRARDVKHGLSTRAEHMRDTGREWMHSGRERAIRVQERTRTLVDENPLAFGLGLFAAGIGIGMMLPITSSEKRVLGPARDRLVGQAREVAQEVRASASRLGEAAERVGETTRSTVSDVKGALTEPSPPH